MKILRSNVHELDKVMLIVGMIVIGWQVFHTQMETSLM